MRKTSMVIIIILLMQSFTGIGAFAASNTVEKPVDGTVTKISYTQVTGAAGNLTISVKGAVIANRELWIPDATHSFYRLIVDLKNANINTPGVLVVNKGKVLQVRYSQFDAIRSRFVVDISEKPTYAINVSADKVGILLNGGTDSGTVTTSPATAATPKPPATATAKPKASSAPTPAPKPAAVSAPTPATATAKPKASSAPTPAPKPAAVSVPTPATATAKPKASSAPTPAPKPAAVSAPTPAPAAAISNTATKGPLSWTMMGDTCILKIENTDIAALSAQGAAKVENRILEKTLQITLNGMDPRFIAGAMPGNAILYGTLISKNELRQSTTIRLSGKSALAYTMENSGAHTILRIKPSGSMAGNAASSVSSNIAAGMGSSKGTTSSGAGAVSGGTTPAGGKHSTGGTTPAGGKLSTGGATSASGTLSTGGTTSASGTLSTGGTVAVSNTATGGGAATSAGSATTPVFNANTSVSRSTSRTLPVQVSATMDAVTITSADVSLSRVYRMGRNIIIELPGVAVATSLNIGSILVKDVTGISVGGRVKLVVSTGVFTDWIISETAGKLVIRFIPLDITNIEGGDDADVVLRITGQDIVSRYRAAIDQIVVDDDLQLAAFTFMFPTSVISLGNGVASTNDTLSKGFTTLTTGQSSFLSIAKRSGDTQFRLVEDPDGNTLTIRKSVAEAPVAVANGAPRLVVLDAGHGGMDPGTVFEGVYESTVNLDITLRTEAILKQRGVKVLLVRATDVFVGLDERCNIANNANASLFVSIHQNSMPDPATRGTMTLYYASSVNGKRYADLMQQTLVPALGMGSLGLKSSSGMVVLRKTKMPAILTESGCMSNPQDMQVIKTDAYRQTAATAIADGIVKILASMN